MQHSGPYTADTHKLRPVLPKIMLEISNAYINLSPLLFFLKANKTVESCNNNNLKTIQLSDTEDRRQLTEIELKGYKV